MVRLKRANEPAARADGYRVLVDRLWPRGLRKFGHEPSRYAAKDEQHNNAVVLADELGRRFSEVASAGRAKGVARARGASSARSDRA